MMSTSIYLSPSQPPFPLEEHNQAQQDHEQLFNREHHQDDEVEKYILRDESSDDRILSSTHSTDRQSDGNSRHLHQQEHDEVMKDENYASSGHIHHGLSIKWMSSKMRLMKKMSSTDHNVLDKQSQMAFSSLDNDNNSSNNSSSSNNIVRTCSDCNTTKTPLWRSGPRGPKSLCNACGIRQRKARRAMAAAQAEASDTTLVTSETSSTKGNKLRTKAKRCKLTIRRSQKKLCFEDLALSLSKSSAYHQVFPQDEKEAAILLMALSCGRPSSWLNGFL